MNRTIQPGILKGSVPAMPSKSDVHRLILAAYLSGEDTEIDLNETNQDINATIGCIRDLGAKAEYEGGILRIRKGIPVDEAVLNCHESGSTARFIVPICAALGLRVTFHGEGRLPQRPMKELTDELRKHGVRVSDDHLPMSIEGQLTPGVFTLPGNVSSQYFTGLLFALPLLPGDSVIQLSTPIESAAYIHMTEDVLKRFGIETSFDGQQWTIHGNQTYHSPGKILPDGDWSGAAFWLAAGAMQGKFSVTGLRQDSIQGDKEILSLLEQFGAEVTFQNGTATVMNKKLKGIQIDASQIPDLVPILAVVAGKSEGITQITGAARLRIKESDRLATTAAMLTALGVQVEELPDGLIITGSRFKGGKVNGSGDHRIVMSAAIAALSADSGVEISGSEAVNKSYPEFFELLEQRREIV